MSKKNNKKDKNILLIKTIAVFVALCVAGGLLYMFFFSKSLTKKNIDIPEKNKPEEIVNKFITNTTTMGTYNDNLGFIFGEAGKYINRKTRLEACLVSKSYIDNKIYESTCDEGIINQTSDKTPYFFTSKPENIKMEVKSKEEVVINDKKTYKVTVSVDFDVIKTNYITNVKKSNNDKYTVDLVSKKYEIRDAKLVLMNSEDNGWTIIDMEDLNNKATNLLATWNNIGNVFEYDKGNNAGTEEKVYTADEVNASIEKNIKTDQVGKVLEKEDENQEEE